MFELLEEGFNLGLGVASTAVGKVEALVEASLDKAGIKGKDSKELRAKFVEEGKAVRSKLQQELRKRSGDLSEFTPNADKLDAIMAKLEALEAQVAELSKKA